VEFTVAAQSRSWSKIFIVEKCGVQPGLREHSQGTKHPWEVSSLCARFSGAIHGDLDSLVVGGDLHGLGHDGDGDGEALATSTSSNESEIREFSELILHDSSTVPDFPAPVVVIATFDADQGSVWDLLKSKNFESTGQRFVAPPVLRKRSAEDAR